MRISDEVYEELEERRERLLAGLKKLKEKIERSRRASPRLLWPSHLNHRPLNLEPSRP